MLKTLITVRQTADTLAITRLSLTNMHIYLKWAHPHDSGCFYLQACLNTILQ